MTFVISIIVLILGVGFLAVFLVKSVILPKKAQAAAGLLNKNKNLEAIRAGKAAVEQDPKDAEAHYNLGRAFLAEGRAEQALREYKSVARLGIEGKNIPGTEFHETLARLYAQFGEKEEALKEYIALIKNQGDNPEYYYQAGLLFNARNRSDLAEQYLNKAAALNPKEPKYYAELGAVLTEAKKTREAAAALEQALKYDPANAKIQYYMGKALKDAKNYTESIDWFEKASRDQTYRGRALVEMGGAYMSLKMIDKAIAELERAVSAIADEGAAESLYARYFLGMCFESKREYAKALGQWDKIYLKKKNFRDVGEKLTKYQQYRKSMDDAE